MASSSELPYFCPRCGDRCRFPSVAELRAHLVGRHTYETLLVLSQAQVRRSRSSALLPLPGPTAPQSETSSLDLDARGFPLPLACLDLASSSTSVQLLRGTFGPPDRALPPPPCRGERPSVALALPGSLEVPGRQLGEAGLVGLDFRLSMEIGLEERLGLGLDHKIARTFAEVEERMNGRVGRLKAELKRREAELEQKTRDRERLRREKKGAEERATYLSIQLSAAVEMTERLKTSLAEKEAELSERQQEVADVELFLRQTAEKEAEAKSRLQTFIETLLERVDQAETQLLLLSPNYFAHDGYAEPEAYSPSPRRAGRSLDCSTDDILCDKMQESLGNRRSFSVSGAYRLGEEMNRHHYSGLNEEMRTLSLGSAGWDPMGGLVHLNPPHYNPHWTPQETDGFRRRDRVWVAEEGWGRTWSKRNVRHHSTEEEEEEEDLWSSAEMRRLNFSRKFSPRSDTPSSIGSTPSRHRANRQPRAESLRMRAGLFCVFPYLDVRSLLCAAEVCSDWRAVARHPAVWTHLRLENARLSAEFLQNLSQWCTQTQSVVLNNLKPRSRRPDETREDYHKNTRGSVEPGVEALLRSAGGSLLHLSVSQCPHILTDRTLWMASCHCRGVQTLTYRSSSDPVGQEVLWALGAGCRNISALHVAPAHPSCPHLEVLELERVPDLGLQAATELSRAGLRSLRTLVLTHTPVSGQAILHFHSACASITSIVVDVSVGDYFEEHETQEAKHLFGEILSTLQVLQTRPGLCDVLQVKAEGFS